MRRLFCIGIIGCLGCSSAWSQQWTAQDSLWLKRVLAGEDSVRLDPEVKRAIEQQTLINEGTPVGQPQLAPRQELPISKDFSEYIRTDDNPRRKIPLNQLPPNVFWHHNPPFKRLPAVYESIQEELRRNPPQVAQLARHLRPGRTDQQEGQATQAERQAVGHLAGL